MGVKISTGKVEKLNGLRCEHHDRLNFCTAKAWQRRGCMDAWLPSWKKRKQFQTDTVSKVSMDLRVVSLLALLGSFATGQKFDRYLVNIASWEGP